MKRVLKIILILIAAFALALLIIWLIGRNKSQKTGQNPLSFKQFLGLSTKTTPGETVPGETSSTFTGDGSGNNTGNNGSGNGTNANGNGNGTGINGNGGFGGASDNNPQISNFTDGGLNPGGNPGGGTGGNGGNPGGGGNGSDGNGSNGGNPTGSGSSTGGNPGGGDNGNPIGTGTTNEPVCSQEDTNIVFTADELAQLKELQNRFYTIAQTLHTDADVDTEVANHDAFAVKADQVTEMYNYCEQKLPLITDPHLQQRVATPFWHTDADSLSFINFSSNGGLDIAHLTDVHDNNHDLSHNADTSGIKGPWGILSWSTPKAVAINGSILKTNAKIDPFSGKIISSGQADTQLLIPVIEKILRINLW